MNSYEVDPEEMEKLYEGEDPEMVEKYSENKNLDSINIAYLTMNSKGYMINSLKLYPYAKKNTFVAEYWKAKKKIKKRDMPNKEII
jgi:hypothetical protein